MSAFSSVQSLSHVLLFATPRTAARQASLSITNSQSLPKLMSIELVMPSNHLILHHPLLLLPSNLSQHQGLFQGVSSSYLLSLALGKCLHLSGPQFSSVQSFSHVQLFAHPMDCSTSGLPVHHQLPEFTQTHFHRISDAIQPSHPLSSPVPPALNLSQPQGLFT